MTDHKRLPSQLEPWCGRKRDWCRAQSVYDGDMIRVCFVCLGNICRSPTAEAVVRHHAEKGGLLGHLFLDSAGTGAYHVGERPDRRSSEAAKRRSITLSGRARQFHASDFEQFDYVLAMDADNLAALKHIVPASFQGVLALFRDFDESAGPNAGVPDPYFGGEAGFEEVLDQCERAARGLLRDIQRRLKHQM